MRVAILEVTQGFQYEVVNIFAEELLEGFEKIGWEVQLIEVNQSKKDFYNEMMACIGKGLDLVLHFNGFLTKELNGCSIIYECLKVCEIPVGVILVDHPFYHMERMLKFDRKNTFICMYNEDFLHTFERYIDDRYIIAQLMHGGSKAKSRVNEKVYDVIVAGTIHKPEDLDSILKDVNEDVVKEIFLKIYEKAQKDYTIPLDTYFNEEFQQVGLHEDAIRNKKKIKRILAQIYVQMDKNLRQKLRYEAIQNLLEEGVEVEVYGNCQVDELRKYSNLHIHGAIDYPQLLDEMAEAKIVVHDLNVCSNGSHERVFSGILNKALVVSNQNNYCNGLLKDGESIVYYNPNNIAELVEKVKYYLAHEEERNKIVNNAYEIINDHHEWRNRAIEIENIYKTFKEIQGLIL